MIDLLRRFGMFGPMTMCFKDDGGAGTGDDDLNKPGGAGGAGKDLNTGDDNTGKKTPDDETFELDVDGTKRTITLDEMRELATKSAGADARFQSAAEMRKEAEAGIRIGTLVKTLEGGEGTDLEAKELAVLLGIEPGELMEYLKDGDDDTDKDDKGNQAPVALTDEQFKAAYGFFPAEAKQILAHSQDRHIASARQELREISDKAVDTDAVFGKMVIGEKKDARMEVIKDMVAEDVLGKIEHGQQFGADMVTASIQKVRTQFTKFGIPNDPVVNPVVLGLGPGVQLPTEVQAEEPIKRINAFESGADDNLVKRYLQKAVKAARNLTG